MLLSRECGFSPSPLPTLPCCVQSCTLVLSLADKQPKCILQFQPYKDIRYKNISDNNTVEGEVRNRSWIFDCYHVLYTWCRSDRIKCVDNKRLTRVDFVCSTADCIAAVGTKGVNGTKKNRKTSSATYIVQKWTSLCLGIVYSPIHIFIWEQVDWQACLMWRFGTTNKLMLSLAHSVLWTSLYALGVYNQSCRKWWWVKKVDFVD